MKIVCIVAALSQPRCIKRIKALYEDGYEIDVYGYRRGLYEVNEYPSEIKVNELGFAVSGKGYIKKFLNNLKNIKEIIKKYPSDTIFYGFSFDIALSLLLHKRKFIYEISDIIYAYYNSQILKGIFRSIDKIIIKKSLFTIMTSEGFKNYLFPNSNVDNIIIQPNKVSPFLRKINRKVKEFNSNKIVFAYIGAFRYPNTIFRFARIIGKYFPQYEYHFYGNSNLTPLVIKLTEEYPNIKYFGEFKSPEDLENVYSNVDIVTACYDNTGLNERIAEPNKLYEAICFCCPIIVSENTFLGEKVNKLKVGYVINPNNDENIIEFINNLKKDELIKISKNEFSLSAEEYIDTTQKLLEQLKRSY